MKTSQQQQILLLFISVILIQASVIKQCQISVKNAKVIQIRPKILKIQCHSGYSTSTGQDILIIKCKKKLRDATLNFCHPKSKSYSHPYPLFQSDDPKVSKKFIQ